MTARDYIEKVLKSVRERHADKPEFIQAVAEFFPTLEPYLDEHPEMIEKNILALIVEPERVIQFRVPWEDDDGNVHVNLGYRVQYNSALGPYKGGTRFDPSVNESVLRFLGFEQTFKNALTSLPLGGGKGGSDFSSRGRSDREIMRFVQSFMTELQRYLGPDLDVPAGDVGVGHREIGYMYGQYKRLNKPEPGVLTGKPTGMWGSFGRTESTGYGVMYFAENALKDRGLNMDGMRVAVSGCGKVGTHAIEKATALGATVVAVSDRAGYIYDPTGVSADIIRQLPYSDRCAIGEYVNYSETASYFEGESIWSGDFEYDMAFPCATQNEINKEMAENMVQKNKLKAVFEGANMPSTDAAIEVFKEHDILFAPGKAVNAGGVAVSGLEMTQNSQREQWDFEVVDARLQEIMRDIYTLISDTAEQYVGDRNNLQAGANIAGFARVAEAMMMQGLV